MDDCCAAPTGPSRRAFLRAASAAVLSVPMAALLGGPAAAAPLPLKGVTVRPRTDWAGGLAPTGPLRQERPGDVRFLLVHHTASGNGYAPDEVPALLRGFYGFHTGPEKGWPDVAYNFFVDRYGTVWEGRTGSLQGPVQPDATGGSQGFAQLCCFVGDHQSEPPTPEAQRAMTALLAALAEVYGIDPAPGATATFVSRGSNRWPAGAPVTTPTIAGHRDMSLTSCPGDAAYALVRDAFPAGAAALLAARTTAPSSAPTPAPAPAPASSASPERTASSPARATTASPSSPVGGTAGEEDDDGIPLWTAALVGGGVVVAGGAAGYLVHGRRSARNACMLRDRSHSWSIQPAGCSAPRSARASSSLTVTNR